MTLLSLLLSLKIIITLFAVIIPLVGKSPAIISELYGLKGSSNLVFRLYAVALFALLVNYSFGLFQGINGTFPTEIIWVGIVSNVGAAIVLFLDIMKVSTEKAPVSTPLPFLVFGGIGLSLILCLVFPDFVMKQW